MREESVSFYGQQVGPLTEGCNTLKATAANPPEIFRRGQSVEKDEEELKRLCTQAASEQDGVKLVALVHQINLILDRQIQRMKGKGKAA